MKLVRGVRRGKGTTLEAMPRDAPPSATPLTLPDGALLLTLSAPWRDVLPLLTARVAALVGRRLYVQCAAHWDGTAWHDGPLAHVLPDGRVASYVPSGGAATLELPAEPADTGISWAEALALEGTPGERLLRCFCAELDARLPDSDLHFSVQTPDLASACVLAVARKMRYDDAITILVHGTPHPTFRRFAQNAGLLPAGAHAAKGLSVAGYALGLPPSEVALLAAELNRRSALLPESLLCMVPPNEKTPE